MKASRRITQQNIRISRLGCRHRIVDDRRRVCALLSADHIHTGAVCPLLQLVSRRCAEGIRCRKHDLFPLVLELSRQLSNGCGLAHAVDTDHENHGFLRLKAVCRLADIHLLLDAVNQKFLALCRIFDVILLHFFLETLNDRLSRIDADVSHNQNLLDLLIEIIVNAGKSTENGIYAGYDIISRLAEALDQTSPEAFLFLAHNVLIPPAICRDRPRSDSRIPGWIHPFPAW